MAGVGDVVREGGRGGGGRGDMLGWESWMVRYMVCMCHHCDFGVFVQIPQATQYYGEPIQDRSI